MKFSRIYSLTTGLMVGVFSLFTFGIPVVIASCPMPKGTNNLCVQCVQNDTSGTERVTRASNGSCCATVILATGNTTEFERAHSFAPAEIALNLSVSAGSVAVDVAPPLRGTTSPFVPLLDDIPIRCSALLI